jgi:hypothetical protein
LTRFIFPFPEERGKYDGFAFGEWVFFSLSSGKAETKSPGDPVNPVKEYF